MLKVHRHVPYSCRRLLRAEFRSALSGNAGEANLLKLPDGRQLCWREYGDLIDGFPVIFLHGTLNSRFFAPVWSKTVTVSAAAGARVIAVDRQGYGLSTFCTSHTYQLTAQDVAALAAHLDLKKMIVLGYSSGGPNALACAHELPHLIAACGLISSDGPYTMMDPAVGEAVFGMSISDMTPALAEARKQQNATSMMKAYRSMRDPSRVELAVRDLEEALRQGYAGAIQDSMLETRHWGFDLQGVDSVPVLIWHGTDDTDVPYSAGAYLADNIASLHEAVFIQGENHTLIRRHWSTILERTINAASVT